LFSDILVFSLACEKNPARVSNAANVIGYFWQFFGHLYWPKLKQICIVHHNLSKDKPNLMTVSK
jgi:hypothetical protein